MARPNSWAGRGVGNCRNWAASCGCTSCGDGNNRSWASGGPHRNCGRFAVRANRSTIRSKAERIHLARAKSWPGRSVGNGRGWASSCTSSSVSSRSNWTSSGPNGNGGSRSAVGTNWTTIGTHAVWIYLARADSWKGGKGNWTGSGNWSNSSSNFG